MNIFFDIIIFGFLLADLLFLIWLIYRKKESLHPLAFKLIVFLAVLLWAVIFYGSFISPRTLVIRQQTIELDYKTNKQKTIALVSDLHVGPYKGSGYLDKVVKRILQQEPEVIILLGDYIFDGEDALDQLNPLQSLTKEAPVYAVMGNHDYDLMSDDQEPDNDLAEKVRSKLKELDIIVLENEGVVERGIYIAGIQELWTDNTNLEAALENREFDMPTILAIHNPDIISQLSEKSEFDLIVAGHTHGGQIRLPLIGPIGKIPTKLGQEIDQGFFEIDDKKLFITSGAGESGPRARLFNPPEIAILDLLY